MVSDKVECLEMYNRCVQKNIIHSLIFKFLGQLWNIVHVDCQID